MTPEYNRANHKFPDTDKVLSKRLDPLENIHPMSYSVANAVLRRWMARKGQRRQVPKGACLFYSQIFP